MAVKDYLPKKDADFLAWSTNFSTLINAAPTTYGITAEIATDYGTKQSDFATKLAAATNPETRGNRTVFLKDESKKILIAATRPLAQQIGRTMSVTDAQRQALGITVPSGSRTPKPRPVSQPFIKVLSISGRSATVELQASTRTRGKATNATAATIFTFAGDAPPMDPGDWTFAMNTTKTTETLVFPPSDTGNTVWVTAFWSNAKLQSGPGASAISINLPAGGLLPQASESVAPQKVQVRRAA